jgi:hypothetical protein
MPTKSSGFGGSNQMRALAMSAPGAPAFVPPAPVPTYGSPGPIPYATPTPAPVPTYGSPGPLPYPTRWGPWSPTYDPYNPPSQGDPVPINGPVPTYGIPVASPQEYYNWDRISADPNAYPLSKVQSFTPWSVSGLIPIPTIPSTPATNGAETHSGVFGHYPHNWLGDPVGTVDPAAAEMLSRLQMGWMSRYIAQTQPRDISTYLPGLFGGGQNTSGAAPVTPYQLPAPYPVSGNVPITYSSDIPYWEKGPKSQYFDPQAWTDY